MMDGEPLARPLAAGGPMRVGGACPATLLFDDLAPELRRFVVGVVRDPDLADDVLQATFLKALERGHEARPETARGWLFRVAFHEALAARRRDSTRARGLKRLAGLGWTANAQPPDGRMIKDETVALVREAMARLPEEQRTVVLARICDDKTFAEIAAEAGLPLGTVLTRMRRALEKMRKTLRPGG
jgi:RNA polymerase sigma-70 factor (ECF subfamily)